MDPEVVTYPDRAAQAEGLAAAVAARLADGLAARDRVALAVPGGTTPGPFLDALSHHPLDWARVDVMLTDERFVPESAPRSNTALLRRSLLRNAAASARLVPLVAEAETPEAVLEALTEGLRAALPLEVCVLGMGADLHIASLFPGADRLDEGLADTAPPLLPMRAPGAPEPRLSLTAPVLTGAGACHLLIAGDEKRAAFERAQAVQPVADAPVRLLFARPLTVHWTP